MRAVGALDRINRHSATKKFYVVLIFNWIFLKIHFNYFGAPPPLPHNFAIILPCTSNNKRIKLFEIVRCFNFEQV